MQSATGASAGLGILLLSFSRLPIYLTPQAADMLQEISRERGGTRIDEGQLPPDILLLCDSLESHLMQDRPEHAWNHKPVERTLDRGRAAFSLQAFILPPQHTLHGSQILILIQRLATTPPLRESPNGPAIQLTARQRIIVQGVIRGLTNKELAVELGLSAHTVKEYVRQIMMRLNTTSRAGIVSRMAGLLPVTPRTSRRDSITPSPQPVSPSILP
jgi:DNA-binding CsgD family transcriptional regulator